MHDGGDRDLHAHDADRFFYRLCRGGVVVGGDGHVADQRVAVFIRFVNDLAASVAHKRLYLRVGQRAFGHIARRPQLTQVLQSVIAHADREIGLVAFVHVGLYRINIIHVEHVAHGFELFVAAGVVPADVGVIHRKGNACQLGGVFDAVFGIVSRFIIERDIVKAQHACLDQQDDDQNYQRYSAVELMLHRQHSQHEII